MKGWRLFLDDERFPADKDRDMVVLRSVEDVIEYIKWSAGAPVFISFDHDLGPGVPTGYDLAKWLVETDLDAGGVFLPENFTFTVHSQNPVGAANIIDLLTQYLEQRNEPTEPMHFGL